MQAQTQSLQPVQQEQTPGDYVITFNKTIIRLIKEFFGLAKTPTDEAVFDRMRQRVMLLLDGSFDNQTIIVAFYPYVRDHGDKLINDADAVITLLREGILDAKNQFATEVFESGMRIYGGLNANARARLHKTVVALVDVCMMWRVAS